LGLHGFVYPSATRPVGGVHRFLSRGLDDTERDGLRSGADVYGFAFDADRAG